MAICASLFTHAVYCCRLYVAEKTRWCKQDMPSKVGVFNEFIEAYMYSFISELYDYVLRTCDDNVVAVDYRRCLHYQQCVCSKQKGRDAPDADGTIVGVGVAAHRRGRGPGHDHDLMRAVTSTSSVPRSELPESP